MRAVLMGPIERVGPALSQMLRKLKITKRDVLIGVDGGVDLWLRAGFKPRLAIGDWDSQLARIPPRGISTQTLPSEKDRSDLHFALRAAIGLGASEVICLGVTGARPDHHYGSLHEIAAAASSGKLARVSAHGRDGDYYFQSARMKPWIGRGIQGKTVSIFAVGGPARGVTLHGFKYPLSGATLGLSTHGLSNIALSRSCQVTLKSGQLIIIVPSFEDQALRGRRRS